MEWLCSLLLVLAFELREFFVDMLRQLVDGALFEAGNVLVVQELLATCT